MGGSRELEIFFIGSPDSRLSDQRAEALKRAACRTGFDDKQAPGRPGLLRGAFDGVGRGRDVFRGDDRFIDGIAWAPATPRG